MPRYFLDKTDGDFDLWQSNFLEQAPAVLAVLSMDAAALTPVAAALADRSAARVDAEQKLLAARAATQAKHQAHAAAVESVAALVRQLQAHPALTDAQRIALGLPVRDAIRTVAPPPETAPRVIVDASQRLLHRLRFLPEGTRRGKPRGTIGVQVYRTIGAPPSAQNPPLFATFATRSPAVVSHAAADAGKMAYYQLCWLNAKGQGGPWSPIVEATIAG